METAHNAQKAAEGAQDIGPHVARLLRAGKTPDQIAAELNISVDFVRAREALRNQLVLRKRSQP